MSPRRALCASAFLVAGASLAAALAAEVLDSRLSAARQWERGRLRSLSVAADGSLALAPALRPLNLGADGPPPYLLCQVRDGAGNLYVGAGGPARVFKFTTHGNATLLFQGEELQVTALATDSKDQLYVATSPRGRVYRIGADGEARSFFEAEERYLWSLAVDGAGQVWVGTGERGRLYRVDSAGRGRVVLDSPDPHVTALAVEADGGVVAGTDGRSLVYRIGRDSTPRAIFEGGLRQVTSLAVGADRTLYVGLLAPASPPPAPERRREAAPEPLDLGPTLPFEREAPLPLGEEAPPVTPLEALEPPPRPAPRSRIVAIDASGAPRELWSAEGTWLHALALDTDGTVYFGTGEPACLYSLRDADRPTLLHRLEAAYVTSVAVAGRGRIALTTGRPGLAIMAGDALADSGSLESEPLDAGAPARWGRVRWQAEAPAGSRLELFSRTGNSAHPDAAWSDWSAAYADASGSAIVSPAARYLQWRIVMNRGKDGRSPRLRELSFSHLGANRPPRLEHTTLHPPGEYFLPDGGPERRNGGGPAPGRPRHRQGLRSVSWQASDPDGDRLVGTLRLRALGGGDWKVLASGVTSSYYTWSVADLPEGWHEVQVEVSDEAANPPALAAGTSSSALAFKVDHTPPEIEITRDAVASASPTLELRVRDALSPVREVHVWVDAEPPRRLPPADGLEDSMREEYRWQGAAVPRRLRVEARDSEGNRAEWEWARAGAAGG